MDEKGFKNSLNAAGYRTLYRGVNKKAEELSERLRVEGYSVPVVADTDLHTRNGRHLRTMGTARVITDVEGESASDIVCSIKTNIFNGLI